MAESAPIAMALNGNAFHAPVRRPAPGKGLTAIHTAPALSGPLGGVPATATRMCEALAAIGCDVSMLVVGGPGERIAGHAFRMEAFPNRFAGMPLVSKLCSSPQLEARLRAEAPSVDILHAHGLWLMSNIYPLRAARRAGKPCIVSPHGMLSPEALKVSPARKRLFWRLFQGQAMHAADCLHATSDAEYADLRALGLSQPVAIVPNGVDLPRLGETDKRGARILLFVGRLHPIKGLDSLVEAWARLERQHPDWVLRIAGPAPTGYGEELKRKAARLGCTRIEFPGALAGDGKDAAYRGADLYVQPSLSENFSLTVAEALSHGAPVVASRGTPWSGLETHRCGWWVDHGAEPLFQALDRAMRLPRGELEQMGRRGRQWMARDFAAESVALRILAVYRWMIDGGEPPADIRVT